MHILTLPSGAGLMQPPMSFLSWTLTVWSIVLKFCIAYYKRLAQKSFAQLLVKKKLVGSGQVT